MIPVLFSSVVALAVPSTNGLIIGGIVTLACLAIFLRIKFG
jgi:hypothetical protein